MRFTCENHEAVPAGREVLVIPHVEGGGFLVSSHRLIEARRPWACDACDSGHGDRRDLPQEALAIQPRDQYVTSRWESPIPDCCLACVRAGVLRAEDVHLLPADDPDVMALREAQRNQFANYLDATDARASTEV